MFITLKSTLPKDEDMPERAFELTALEAVLNGTLYDHLPNAFHDENNRSGEYIPIRQRRPSVKYALCRIVVDESVAMLFSEGHFPDIDCADEATRDALQAIIKTSKLNEAMIHAATVGSIGSVAILMRVLSKRLFFDVMRTATLTPEWNPEEPDKLLRVTEKYKVDPAVLIESGYSVDETDGPHWFQRVWDGDAETWFLPWPVKADNPVISVDIERTVTHNLGFVPIVWIKNLPGGNGIDGACTFRAAIDTSIEIDYQLSQAGRGLKYSSDPTLLIKEPALGQNGEIIKGAGNALIVAADGDARMLEINGTAAQAVMDYVRMLRELAIESIHGNRSNADKISSAQSGRAMELLNQSLIRLADKLRISYGEGALLDLLKMIVSASEKTPITIDGKRITLSPEPISLRWPAWYAPTSSDMTSVVNAVKTAKDGGIISQETAVKQVADAYDIEDTAAEIKLIKAEQAEQAALLAETAQVTINE